MLLIERKAGLQEEPRLGLRFLQEVTPEEPIVKEVEENSDGTVTFRGYLLKWSEKTEIRDFFGSYFETFTRGAFKKTFRERGPQGNNAIKMLRQHETRFGTFIAGKFTDLHEDDIGPAFEGRTILTETGKNLAVEIREEVINSMSIGFDAMREEYIKEENLFDVKEAKLYEASPVYWPAYESATIDSFRSVEQLVPVMARFFTMIEAGHELTEEQYGQLRTIHARISEVLGEPRGHHALSRGTQHQATTEDSEATAGETHRSAEEVLARLRIAEREYGLN